MNREGSGLVEGKDVIGGILATLTAIIGIAYRRKDRVTEQEEKRAAIEDRGEEREMKAILTQVKLLEGHAAQLERLWEHSLTEAQKLRLENAELRAENLELRKKQDLMEQHFSAEIEKLKSYIRKQKK